MKQRYPILRPVPVIGATVLTTVAIGIWSSGNLPAGPPATPQHMEVPVDPPANFGATAAAPAVAPAADVVLGEYRSVQVNVNAQGFNILGDAANEPSIAVDPGYPNRMAIGWRQFDTIANNFRQAGNAHTTNGGATWNYRPVLTPGQFRSDPVLESDADGNFYYYSLSALDSVELFKSTDGGATWSNPVVGWGGDKQWMTIDRTSGIGRGHIYTIWNVQFSCCGLADFARSTNGGLLFESPQAIPPPSMKWGTLTVGPDGELYVVGSTLAGNDFLIARSANARDSDHIPVFDFVRSVNLGGEINGSGLIDPNPAGLLGQVWVATDHSGGPNHGSVYVLASVARPNVDVRDVMFVRSRDGGVTWSTPIRVNDDLVSRNAYQWFGTMSVAPNGRLDVIWNDTRNFYPLVNWSELYYAYSHDAGMTWSDNVPVSPPFDSHIGWPQQNKLGDYYDMVSDNDGVSIAYAATFNGEQDVYYLRIGARDCNGNGAPDEEDLADETSLDCNANEIPDECEWDCNDSGQPDDCDVWDMISADCNTNSRPDECEADFDQDGTIDECDSDLDGDGVNNSQDFCKFTPVGVLVDAWGRPIGDTNGTCSIDLPDFVRFPRCISGPGVMLGSTCTTPYDYPESPGGLGDHDIDLRDFSHFQFSFGRE